MQAVRGDAPSLKLWSLVTMKKQRATVCECWKPTRKASVKARCWRLCRGQRAWHVWREASKNLGGPQCSREKRVSNLYKERLLKVLWESDRCIVLRDGRTDHTGKAATE